MINEIFIPLWMNLKTGPNKKKLYQSNQKDLIKKQKNVITKGIYI